MEKELVSIHRKYGIPYKGLKKDEKILQTLIKKGYGKCMTAGLGIGVLPYLWLLKDNVESVVVVEFNKEVICLFEEYIRTQFKTNKTLKIIHGDAFD